MPTLDYAGAPAHHDVRVFFDTTDTGRPVTTHTGALLGLMDVDPALPGSDKTTGRLRPPTVVFHWGDLHSFKPSSPRWT